MSQISTSQQWVDSAKYDAGYHKTYTREKESRPGKTVYVWRNGHLEEKTSDMFIAMITDPGRPNANFDVFAQKVMHEMFLPKERLEHRDRSVSVGLCRG